MKRIRLISLLLTLTFVLLASSGCSSTRTENGVSIEKQRNANPLSFLPFL